MKKNIYIVSALLFVVVACLAAVYAVDSFTAPIIEQQLFNNVEDARKNIFSTDYPSASYKVLCSEFYESDYYADLDITDECNLGDLDPGMESAGIVEVTEVTSGGKVVGYSYWAEANGYGGTIYYVIGIAMDDAETVLGLEVVSNSETPGLGDKIQDEEFTEDFDHKPAAEIEAGVDGVTSATPHITNGAMQSSVNQVIAYYRLTTQGRPDPLGIPEADLNALLNLVGLAGATGVSVYNDYDYNQAIGDMYEISKDGSVVGYVYYFEYAGQYAQKIKIDYYIDTDGNAVDFRFRDDSSKETWDEAAEDSYNGSQGLEFEESPWLNKFRNTTVDAILALNASSDAVAGVSTTTGKTINAFKAVAQYHKDVIMNG